MATTLSVPIRPLSLPGRKDLALAAPESPPIEDVVADIASREPVSYTIEDLRSFAGDGRP
jgi:hypothetical protein